MSLDSVLEQARAEADLYVAMITDLKGKVIAAARADETPPEALDALLEMATRIASRPEDKTALAYAGESTFFDWEGRRVVCRWFNVDAGPRLLILLLPHDKAYKRAAANIVRAAQQPVIKK